MRYLGKIHGRGALMCGGSRIAAATYDFDRFDRGHAGIVISGEIELAPKALKGFFGRSDVRLRTDGGKVFRLSFDAKEMTDGSGIAYVEAKEQLAAAD